MDTCESPVISVVLSLSKLLLGASGALRNGLKLSYVAVIVYCIYKLHLRHRARGPFIIALANLA